ncbi:MAG: D-2-hydroxyacid dehydrogenase [Nitrospinota bacterium]|nr:D-2-hydroxyacid dehydrogenase [Nitrospinota bacterium]
MVILVYLTHPHVEAWNFQDRHKEQFCRHLPEVSVVVCHNSKEFLARLPEAEGVIVWFFKREWEKSAPRLKWVATPAAGKDWIDVDPGSRLPVLFGGFHGLMMAESVLGAMLYFCKAFQASHDLQKKKKWARIKISQRITSLYQKKVTILGFGRIGQTIGRILKPFGCQLTGVKRTVPTTPPPDYFDANDRVVVADRLMEILPETDHLIFVLPGGAETSEMFTQENFGQLPRHCIVYNVGRGNAYRETDLVHALREKQIAGAYLDVFETEPLPETSELWEMDNVLIQPHLSAASPHYLDLFVEELIPRLLLDD